MMTSRITTVVACSWIVVSSGCSILRPQPDLSRFFVLTPMAQPATPAETQLAIGLGPIEFPAYLLRAQIVTRIGDNEISLSEINWWGESLDKNFNRVLGANLAGLLSTDKIVAFPWYDPAALDYAVQVTVERFEADTSGEARLLARWAITNPTTSKFLYNDESDIKRQAKSTTPDATVAALSECVADLSREIMKGLEAVRPWGLRGRRGLEGSLPHDQTARLSPSAPVPRCCAGSPASEP